MPSFARPVVEWSLVMAGFCWLLIRMWTDTPYDSRDRESAPQWRWLGHAAPGDQADRNTKET